MPTPPKDLKDFKSLLQIIKDLRGPEGCPWDKEQTHKTLTRFAIEEAHELAEAIDQGETPELIEELGDLLLQVVLHAEIARQENQFQIEDVIESISTKMVRRHPHVFGDVKVKDSTEVLKNWDQLKKAEKVKPTPPGFSLPTHLPALLKAFKIGEKTAREKFDWQKPEAVMKKVEEETSELAQALRGGDRNEIFHEIGDLLFSVVQLSRHLEMDPEQCLRECNRRFEKRYFRMKSLAQEQGADFPSLDDEQKERLWTQIKNQT
ncbi:MAG: nucleoside triphosphate pyrophosphohydrolase [Bdellovibrionales bacterium]|nr:nucleoside triphosphate pyrophosphohydrolase [Bdellovibrionales bacterium]